MSFPQLTIQIANQTGLKPIEVQSIETIYDIISRFGFVENTKYLKNLKYQNKAGQINRLPYKLTDFIEKYIFSQGQRTFTKFSPANKDRYFLEFVKYFIANKAQPSNYFFDGVLIYSPDIYAEVVYQNDYELPRAYNDN